MKYIGVNLVTDQNSMHGPEEAMAWVLRLASIDLIIAHTRVPTWARHETRKPGVCTREVSLKGQPMVTLVWCQAGTFWPQKIHTSRPSSSTAPA